VNDISKNKDKRNPKKSRSKLPYLADYQRRKEEKQSFS